MPESAGKQGVLGSAATALVLAVAGLLLLSASARAEFKNLAAQSPSYAAAAGSSCPPIKDKPNQIPHVDYQGVQHITYCVPAHVNPGQNIIRLNPTNLFPQQPGYITRFDPELVYPNGTVPRVDVLHLHHAVWVVNGNPQFAVGEEKTIVQAPKGFGWRTRPTDHWFLNDMLHDLVGQAGERGHRLEDRLRTGLVTGGREHAHDPHAVDVGRRAAAPGRRLESDLSRL